MQSVPALARTLGLSSALPFAAGLGNFSPLKYSFHYLLNK